MTETVANGAAVASNVASVTFSNNTTHRDAFIRQRYGLDVCQNNRVNNSVEGVGKTYEGRAQEGREVADLGTQFWCCEAAAMGRPVHTETCSTRAPSDGADAPAQVSVAPGVSSPVTDLTRRWSAGRLPGRHSLRVPPPPAVSTLGSVVAELKHEFSVRAVGHGIAVFTKLGAEAYAKQGFHKRRRLVTGDLRSGGTEWTPDGNRVRMEGTFTTGVDEPPQLSASWKVFHASPFCNTTLLLRIDGRPCPCPGELATKGVDTAVDNYLWHVTRFNWNRARILTGICRDALVELASQPSPDPEDLLRLLMLARDFAETHDVFEKRPGELYGDHCLTHGGWEEEDLLPPGTLAARREPVVIEGMIHHWRDGWVHICQCAICHDQLIPGSLFSVRLDCCEHRYHRSCLQYVLDETQPVGPKNCPMCNALMRVSGAQCSCPDRVHDLALRHGHQGVHRALDVPEGERPRAGGHQRVRNGRRHGDRGFPGDGI